MAISSQVGINTKSLKTLLDIDIKITDTQQIRSYEFE